MHQYPADDAGVYTANRVGGNRLNQRFHRLFPSNESYVAEMESALFNTVLAQQAKAGEGIRYFTQLTYQKEIPTNGGKCAWAGKGCESSHLGTGPTCCEGQGSRLFASIPEYIFSLSHDGIRVDLFSSASINFTSPAGAAWTLNMETAWPHGEAVQLQLEPRYPLRHPGSKRSARVASRLASPSIRLWAAS